MEAVDDDRKRKTDTRPRTTAPPGAALDDDETSAQKHDPETLYLNFEVPHVPTVVEFVDTEEAVGGGAPNSRPPRSPLPRGQRGVTAHRERVVAALEAGTETFGEYVDTLDELARVIERAMNPKKRTETLALLALTVTLCQS